MRTSIFVITVCQLLVAFAITVALGWSQGDVRAWWPVALIAWAVISTACALVFVLLIAGSPMQNWRVAAAWNGLIAASLIVYSGLFYGMSIDWIGVSQGTVRLSLLQRIVRSNATPYFILLIGLAGPALLRLARAAGEPGGDGSKDG